MDSFNLNLDNTVDEDFFGSLKGKSSKLQQLFVEDALSPNDEQQSLKYQHPKEAVTPSHTTRATLLAKVVTAYRQGELQGKVGLALIQNSDNTCNIIMYKTKAHILVTLKLEPKMNLLYKHTKYWQFYDELSTYWSFSFDDIKDEEEFKSELHIKDITYKENQDKDKDQVEEIHLDSSFIHKTQNAYVGDFAGKEMKNSLIKRMAKMGKPLPTLPSLNQQITTEFSDSSDTEVINTSSVSVQKPFIAPRTNKLCNSKANQQLVPSIVGFNTTAANAIYPFNGLESQYMQMLLTEQRTQGSELRINMNKLENKIEKVLDKLETYSGNNNNQKSEKEDEMIELEEKLLLLKKENRKLKQSLHEMATKECEETRIENLLYGFKEDLRHFNIDYNQDLKTILIELNCKLKETHIQIKDSEKKQGEYEVKVKELNAELKSITDRNIQLENEITTIKQQCRKLEHQLVEKENEILQQKQEAINLQSKYQQKTTNDTLLVKSIMNNLYMDIADKFSTSNLPYSEEILTLIASSIKQQTLQSLQQEISTNN